MIGAEQLREGVSKYRTELMGIAILYIMLHHAQFFEIIDFSYINYFARAGSIGVDIFLFLSGFGLYYSLSKSYDIATFYRRRIIRIIPAFFVIVICYYIFLGKTSSLLEFSTWSSELHDNWFIPFILLMYAVYPIAFNIQRKILYSSIIIATFVTVVLTIYLVYNHHNDIHAVPMLMSQRLPIFFLGSLLADNRFTIDHKHNILKFCIASLFVCLIFYEGWESLLYLTFIPCTFYGVVFLTKYILTITLPIC